MKNMFNMVFSLTKHKNMSKYLVFLYYFHGKRTIFTKNKYILVKMLTRRFGLNYRFSLWDVILQNGGNNKNQLEWILKYFMFGFVKFPLKMISSLFVIHCQSHFAFVLLFSLFHLLRHCKYKYWYGIRYGIRYGIIYGK